MRAAAFRRFALSLPEAEEVETWGEATFQVRGKMFALLAGDGSRASLKASLDQQQALVASDPAVFAPAPYLGRHGWVHVDLPSADADEVTELLDEAWRRTAPKAVVKERG